MKIILFEPQNVQSLSPMILTRAAFSIRCAGTTLFEFLHDQGHKLSWIVRPEISAVESVRHKPTGLKGSGESVLYLNACLVPNIKVIRQVLAAARGKSWLIKHKGAVLAAWVKQSNFAKTRLTYQNIEKILGGIRVKPAKVMALETFTNLWDIIVQNQKLLIGNLKYLTNGYKEVQPGVFVGARVRLAPQTLLDTSQGPILIQDNVTVAPFVLLRGPLLIGAGSQINAFSEIKDSCTLGPVCKVGGEIGASVIQGYSNKQHFGFLGHAWVGEWVNFGAGATNSNSKNTYGEISMAGLRTGEYFLGCVVGDYSKIAIGSMIYTGKVLGVQTLSYGTVESDVPSFHNYKNGKLWRCPIEVAWKMQKAMFKRRGKKVTSAQKKNLQDVYQQTLKSLSK